MVTYEYLKAAHAGIVDDMTLEMKASNLDSSDNLSKLSACVKCGFCLPTCPTYLLWGNEMDSPRGRIQLMRAVEEGRAPIGDTVIRHLDRCVGCMACVTACPSGVDYTQLLESFREQIGQSPQRGVTDRIWRRLLFAVLPYPRRLRLMKVPLVGYRGIWSLVESLSLLQRFPRWFTALADLGCSINPDGFTGSWPKQIPAVGVSRAKTGLLTGCVQRVFFDPVNRATVRTLTAEGCEVVIPSQQGCCGALSWHAGLNDQARRLAKSVIESFERSNVDHVVTNVAGCGSVMKTYRQLFEGDEKWATRAEAFSRKVKDISEVISDLTPTRARRHPLDIRVAYHDPCHLLHGQALRDQPRSLLASIPNLNILPIPEDNVCCGSGGAYNLLQPVAAADLGDRKIEQIRTVNADIVATSNAGCLLQIQAAGRRATHEPPVLHPIQLLDASIRGLSVNELLY